MKLQRMPLILVAIAIGLGGVVYLQDWQKQSAQEATQAKSQPLFEFKEGDIQAFTLKTDEQTLVFVKVPANQVKAKSKANQRNSQDNAKSETAAVTKASAQLSPKPDPSQNPAPAPSPSQGPQVWQMQTPKKTLANDASVAFLLNLVTTSNSQKSFTAPINQLAEYGLDKPVATIDVILQDQKKHRLVLGTPDFNRSAMYAQIDPADKADKAATIHLVSLDFENAVQRPLPEWQDQPAPTPQKPQAKPTLPPPPTP